MKLAFLRNDEVKWPPCLPTPFKNLGPLKMLKTNEIEHRLDNQKGILCRNARSSIYVLYFRRHKSFTRLLSYIRLVER